MSLHLTKSAALLITAALASTSFAFDDIPFRYEYPLDRLQPNGARLILPARLHPEVEVSRELNAQPVHPWLAQVQLVGIGGSATTTTFIDPLQRLDSGDGRLDSNHSFVRAQRLHRSLSGMTTEDMADLRNRSLAARATIGQHANRARIVASPHNNPRIITPPHAAYPAPVAEPLMIIPPGVKPIPSVPRQPAQPGSGVVIRD